MRTGLLFDHEMDGCPSFMCAITKLDDHKKKKNQAYLSSSNYNSVQDLASFLKRVGWQIWNFQVKCKSVGVDDMVNEWKRLRFVSNFKNIKLERTN